MKKLIVSLSLISFLASCGDAPFRESHSIARVISTHDQSINWVRMSPVEAKIYKKGDVLRVNLSSHNITQDALANYSVVSIDTIIVSKPIQK